MKIRKILLLILSMIIVLSLASCGKDNTEQNTPDVAITNNEQQDNTTLEEEEKLELPRPLTLDNKDEFIEVAEQLESKNLYDHYGSTFSWLYIDNTLIIYADELKQPDVMNPELPWDSFKQDIKEIIVADGCKLIDLKLDLFKEAESLETVILPDGIINTPKLTKSTNLKYINVPDTVKIIGDLSGCASLQTIDIPEGVTDLDSTFIGCASLEVVTLPDSIETLNSTFFNCTSLKQVNLPSNLTTLGSSTFRGCESLEEVIIPEGIKRIGDRLFEGCNLTTLKIPSTVKEIEITAFIECTIENIVSDSEYFVVDNGVLINQTENDYYDIYTRVVLTKVIKAQAGIEEYNIPGDVFESYQYAFYGCSDLKSITIPKHIKKIGESTFEKCTSLVDVKIETDSRFKAIKAENEYGKHIFKDCISLKEMPIAIAKDNTEAYYGCTGIDRVDIYATSPSKILEQFDGDNDHTDFYLHYHSNYGGEESLKIAYNGFLSLLNEEDRKHAGHIYMYDDTTGETTLFVF